MASVFLFSIKVYSSGSDVAWRFCGTPNSGRGVFILDADGTCFFLLGCLI